MSSFSNVPVYLGGEGGMNYRGVCEWCMFVWMGATQFAYLVRIFIKIYNS